MPRTYKRWIFTRAREFTPTGTLQLGQILASPFEPGIALMPGGPLPIPATIIVENSQQESVSMDSMDDLTAMFGLWAKVAGAPAGGEAEAKVSRSNELSWHFDMLKGKIMTPTKDYLIAAMRHGEVPEHLKGWKFSKRVYMITGVRTAHGARMEKKNSQSVDTSLKATADATAGGLPVTAGAQAQVSKNTSNSEGFEKASDFVYAYRLNEINYRGKLTQKLYNKGETEAVYGGEFDQDEDEMESEFDDFEVQGIDTEDFAGGDFEPTVHSLTSAKNKEVEYQCRVAH